MIYFELIVKLYKKTKVNINCMILNSWGSSRPPSYSAKLRPQKTSYGRHHMILYAMPRDVPYRRPKDVEI